MGEVYDDAKAAFIEIRDLVGVEIIFRSRLQLCVSSTIQKKRDWQQVGFFEEAMTQVDMLDDDYADFVASGIDDINDPLDKFVELDGLLFQVVGINTNPATPLVHLILTKDK
jgi:hypothetical protein